MRSAFSLGPRTTAAVTQVSPRQLKYGEIPGTTCSCRACAQEAPAWTRSSLGGFPGTPRSPKQAHRHAPLSGPGAPRSPRGQLGLRPRRDTLSPAADWALAAPLVTPGLLRGRSDPRLTAGALRPLPVSPARNRAMHARQVASSPSARARPPRNAPHRPARPTRGEARAAAGLPCRPGRRPGRR